MHYCVYQGEAVLEYEQKKNVIDMFHTEVPLGFTGRGIAGLLAKVSLTFYYADASFLGVLCLN